jgi:hypothetical protein
MARFVFEDETPAPVPSAGRFVFEEEAPAAPEPESKGLGAARFLGPIPWLADRLMRNKEGTNIAARGGLQGMTLGWGEEASAGLAAALPFLDREATAPNLSDLARGQAEDTIGARYRRARDFYRGLNRQAQEADPSLFRGAESVGAVAPALATGGGAALPQGAKLGAKVLAGMKAAAPAGAAYGAGVSEADSLAGTAEDAALGGAGAALLGGGAPAVGAGARRLLAPISRKGAALAKKGVERAAQQSAERETAAVASLEGAARERAANAYRQMERIELALKNPALPAEERTALEAFKASPEYAALVQANAKGILGSAPSALAEREAAAAAAQEAREALPEAIKAGQAELLTPQGKEDVLSYLKSYGWPVLLGYGTAKVGEASGLDSTTAQTLGLVAGFSRSRPGKALLNRLSRPANQAALGNALRRLGSPPAAPPGAAKGAAISLTPEMEALISAMRGRPGLAGAAADEE